MSRKNKCQWCLGDPVYEAYHDNEWGRLITDDNALFALFVLEAAQAGLSRLTVLKRRENYFRAFDGLIPEKVAAYGEDKFRELELDSGIIRNRRKIRAAAEQAKVFLCIKNEFGSFYSYVLLFFPDGIRKNKVPETIGDIPVTSEEAKNMSKDLKKRGMPFAGEKICYSFLEAAGFVNDHIRTCPFREKM